MLDGGRRPRSQDGELSPLDRALNACLLLSDAVGLTTFASEQERYRVPVKGSDEDDEVLLNAVKRLSKQHRMLATLADQYRRGAPVDCLEALAAAKNTEMNG